MHLLMVKKILLVIKMNASNIGVNAELRYGLWKLMEEQEGKKCNCQQPD